MLMSKMTLLYILFSALLSCQHAQKEKEKSDAAVNISNERRPSVNPVQQQPRSTPLSDSAAVRPDTTINRKLVLEDYTSAEIFYSKIQTTDLVENLRSSPVMIFSNAGNNQYLLAYQYEGNTRNTFSSFEIGYVKYLEPNVHRKMSHLDEKSFETESGLSLGLSVEDVIKVKGNSFKKDATSNGMRLTYRIEDASASPFLKRYNMPGYFIEVVFKENKAVKILFGFDYP